MRSIVSFSPFQELRRMADVLDRSFDQNMTDGNFGNAFSVPIDIWEEDNNFFIKAALPGVDPNNVDLSINDGVLTISGEFKDEHEEQSENRRVYHREFRYGRFNRSIRLPEGTNEDNIDAEYRNGFITVRVPRQEPVAARPKKLSIRNADTAGQPSEQKRPEGKKQDRAA